MWCSNICTVQSYIVHVMHSWLLMLSQLGWPLTILPGLPSTRVKKQIGGLKMCSLCCFSDVLPFPPSPQVFGGLGDLLMPAITPQSTGGSTAGSTAGSMGTPVAMGGIAAAPPPTLLPSKTVGGDLDSSLANLIGGRQLLITIFFCKFIICVCRSNLSFFSSSVQTLE